MGLDGGTIVTRSDVLRGQSWRVAKDDASKSTRGGNVTRVPTEAAEKSLERATTWSTCALSSQPLQPPIVACGLGRLYNKDAVLQFLLARKGALGSLSPEDLTRYANQLRVASGALDHITSLKEVMVVHVQRNTPSKGTTATASATAVLPSNGAAAAAPPARPSARAASAGASGSSSDMEEGFVCPITLLPCERHPCSALRPCGHVISDRALRNLLGPAAGGGGVWSASGDASCPVCGSAFRSTLPINGTAEQMEGLRQGLREVAAARQAKKGQQEAGGGGARKRKAEATAKEAED